jgi:hypothetical protein
MVPTSVDTVYGLLRTGFTVRGALRGLRRRQLGGVRERLLDMVDTGLRA